MEEFDWTVNSDCYRNHELVGRDGKKHVLVGVSAFAHVGLTTCLSSVLQCSTLYTGIEGIHCPVVEWYFNPFADKNFEDTTPSPKSPNILIPTKERAIVEYMLLHEKFDEGILIEGLKDYDYLNNGDWSKVYALAPKYLLKSYYVDYWIKEAREWDDDP